jgi:hypothetical protein
MELVGCRACAATVSSEAVHCPNCGHPMAKRGNAGSMQIGKWLVVGLFAFVVGSCVISGHQADQARLKQAADSSAATQARVAEQKALNIANCTRNRESQKQQFSEHVASKKYSLAAAAFDGCQDVLNDPELKTLVELALVQGHMSVAADTKAEASERVDAITALQRDHPDKVGTFATLLPSLQAKADQVKQARPGGACPSEEGGCHARHERGGGPAKLLGTSGPKESYPRVVRCS